MIEQYVEQLEQAQRLAIEELTRFHRTSNQYLYMTKYIREKYRQFSFHSNYVTSFDVDKISTTCVSTMRLHIDKSIEFIDLIKQRYQSILFDIDFESLKSSLNHFHRQLYILFEFDKYKRIGKCEHKFTIDEVITMNYHQNSKQVNVKCMICGENLGVETVSL